MILILGGTTEGRTAVKVADEAGKPYFYSTKGEWQEIQCKHGIRITGGMDTEKMESFCRQNNIRLLVDAAHPFASQLHRTVDETSRTLHLPVIRFERKYPPRTENIIWCEDYADAIYRLEKAGTDRLLALTGVQTIGKLRPYWEKHTCWFRVLERETSITLAQEQGFPKGNLVFYHAGESEALLLETLHPQAILTKESGESGGFSEKVKAAQAAKIPVFAIKRPPLPRHFMIVTGEYGLRKQYPPRTENIIWCEDYADAIYRLEKAGTDRLLALTGVQTIGKLRPYWEKHTCWFRVLERETSITLAQEQGFPKGNLVFYHAGESEALLLETLHPQAILTKESGESGGFSEKVKAAQAAKIPVFAIKRPPLPRHFMIVTGEYGLRKQIEKNIPAFYPLRSGYTTGACATAAAKAALTALILGEEQKMISFRLPDDEEMTLPVAHTEIEKNSATCTVVKDAGDDPDVTHGASIVVTVSFSNHPDIRFLQGEGVGRVTLPGLGLEIGEPAINRIPRQMIMKELSALYDKGLDVTISVPGGKELAQRTFNPKLGIVDGISIIGTSGIVRPFSSEAFVEAIRREVEVCVAVGSSRLIINSGAKSERFVKKEYPGLPAQAFVHYGNFIGETLKIAAKLKVPLVTLGIMIGKAVKLAEGNLDTHSKKVVMNKEFLRQVAMEAGCSPDVESMIEKLTLARELWTLLSEEDSGKFFPCLLEHCFAHCVPLLPEGKLTILLIDEEGNIPFRIQ